jgi:transposase-like protein
MKPSTLVMTRRRIGHKHMSLDEKIEAAHQVLVKKEYMADTARQFRVSVPCISKLCSQLRNRPELLSEWLAVREQKKQLVESATRFVTQLIDNDEIIDSTEQVAADFEAASGARCQIQVIKHVMKDICGLKWKKVRKISLHENSNQNRVLRQ